MKKAKQLASWLLILGVCGLAVPRAHAMDKAAQKKIVRQARQAYYSLQAHGFAGAQADVRPQWQVLLKPMLESNPAGAQAALGRLQHLHFAMSLDSSLNSSLTHQWDGTAPADAESNAAFKQIYGGMDQALSGFFQSWSVFMLKPPFPEVEEAYELEEVEGQYRLSYKDGTAAVVIRMTKDFAISELKISTSDFDSTIVPQLKRTPQGLVLASFLGNYVPTKGPGTVQLKVDVEYQELEGLQLPSRIHLDSSYDGQPTEMELLVVDYRLPAR